MVHSKLSGSNISITLRIGQNLLTKLQESIVVLFIKVLIPLAEFVS